MRLQVRAAVAAMWLVPCIPAFSPVDLATQTMVNTAVHRGSIQDRVPDAGPITPGRDVFAVTPRGEGDNAEILRKWIALARYARDHPQEIDAAVELLRDHPEIAANLAKTDSASRAVHMGTPSGSSTELTKDTLSLNAGEKSSVKRDAAALRAEFAAALDRLSGPVVLVFADGNIRGAARGESDASRVGTGSLGVSLAASFATYVATVAIASTQDTVDANYGASLLTPASGQSLASALFDVHLQRVPVHFYASVARSLWRVRTEPSVQTASATVVGAGALAYRYIALGDVGGNQVGLKVEFGPSVRWLEGDVRSRSVELQEELLKTSGTVFPGLEAGVQISFGSVSGAAQLYRLWDPDDGVRVDGLTGLQLVAGLGVTGQIFGGPLSSRRR